MAPVLTPVPGHLAVGPGRDRPGANHIYAYAYACTYVYTRVRALASPAVENWVLVSVGVFNGAGAIIGASEFGIGGSIVRSQKPICMAPAPRPGHDVPSANVGSASAMHMVPMAAPASGGASSSTVHEMAWRIATSNGGHMHAGNCGARVGAGAIAGACATVTSTSTADMYGARRRLRMWKSPPESPLRSTDVSGLVRSSAHLEPCSWQCPPQPADLIMSGLPGE